MSRARGVDISTLSAVFNPSPASFAALPGCGFQKPGYLASKGTSYFYQLRVAALSSRGCGSSWFWWPCRGFVTSDESLLATGVLRAEVVYSQLFGVEFSFW